MICTIILLMFCTLYPGRSKNKYSIEELTQSKQILESLLNQPVESIAYPGGSYNDTILGLAQAAGYKVGFSTVVGHNSRKTHLHIMKTYSRL